MIIVATIQEKLLCFAEALRHPSVHPGGVLEGGHDLVAN